MRVRWVIAVSISAASLALLLFLGGLLLDSNHEPVEPGGLVVNAQSVCSFVVSGTVRYQGQPVEEATVEVRRYRRRGDPYRTAKTDSMGHFTYVEAEAAACQIPDRYLSVTHPRYRYEHPDLVKSGERIDIEVRSIMVQVF